MEQMLVQLMPLFLIFAIFYFLLIRPQQRRAKEHKEMVAGVQRGDKIVSSGGIRGKVVKVVGEVVSQLGASGPSDMGKVMGAVMGRLKGKADGALISSVVKQILNKGV